MKSFLSFSFMSLLQLKSFRDTWTLADFLSFRVALSFHWSLVMLDSSRNELANLLAKTGATLSFTHFPSPLSLVIAKIRHTRYYTGVKISLTIPSFARFPRSTQRNWPSPQAAVYYPGFASKATS